MQIDLFYLLHLHLEIEKADFVSSVFDAKIRDILKGFQCFVVVRLFRGVGGVVVSVQELLLQSFLPWEWVFCTFY